MKCTFLLFIAGGLVACRIVAGLSGIWKFSVVDAIGVAIAAAVLVLGGAR